jgi:hypothetical protein
MQGTDIAVAVPQDATFENDITSFAWIYWLVGLA